VQGQDNPLASLTIQYADYAHWQRNWLKGEVLDEQLNYWTNQLADVPVVHSLPLDNPRPAVQSFVGRTHHSLIKKATADTLKGFTQDKGATLFMGLHGVFSVLMARYSGQNDIVVGSPIANREQREIAPLIGFFVNTLVLRSDLSDNPSFSQLLNQSKQMLLHAYSHQQVPFEQIVEQLQPTRSLSHGPLFQVMLILQNNDEGTLELPDLTLSPIESELTIAKYDLTLYISEDEQGLTLGWEYNIDLFTEQTIAKMACHFECLLEALLLAPTENVFKVPMMDEHEAQQLLQYNDTALDHSANCCIHELFEAQVLKDANAIAVEFDDRQLSYAQLNAQANQLAHYLIEHQQVKPDTLVGVCTERSIEMVIGILAILKAGGAYVPLDPSLPQSRLKHMLADAGLTTVLTQRHLKTPVDERQAVFVDDLAFISGYSSSNITSSKPHHLAYVIYTSGSTGLPKGVLQTHQTIANLVQGQSQVDNINRPLRTLQFAATGFDVSVQEIFTAWFTGGPLVIISDQDKRDLPALPALLQRLSIERLFIAPALLYWLTEQQIDLTALKEVISAGDALIITPTVAAFFDAHPQCTLWNHYGPTETHVVTTCLAISNEGDKSEGGCPIGKPIANTQAYVVDQHLMLVPQGVPGELLIGGAGLARGYLAQPELSAEKFIDNPFDQSGSRLYKTGDLVRWVPGGNLIFMGRLDHQVKIRGFRVELNEIELALLATNRVKEALVLAPQDSQGERQLVAYVVADFAASNAIELLRQALKQELPEYMIPGVFVPLQRFELTANGKIDHKALPAPDLSSQQTQYVAPSTPLEQTLCDIWQDVLGLERVGITDNFFELGGHSLLATRLVSKINALLAVEMALKTIFLHQTIQTLLPQLQATKKSVNLPPMVATSRQELLITSFAQQRLWFLDKIDGGSSHYNMPGALRLTGDLDITALEKAMKYIVIRHESLRTCFNVDAHGQPIQIIMDGGEFSVVKIKLSASEAVQYIARETAQTFNLSQDMMLRAKLITVSVREHILVVTMHHIASDGWSMNVLIDEFSTLYNAFAQGQESPLPPLAIQYADYARWQRDWLQGEVLDKQLAYWTAQLADLPVIHNLPMDKPRPLVQTFAGKSHHYQLSKKHLDDLMAVCQANGATLFMGLHAAFSVLMARYSNETDIVVGSPIANREQVEVAPLIGFFVNTLVLRSDLSNNPTFVELLNQSKDLLLDAYTYQQVPFEQLAEKLQPQRSQSHSPLFQLMLVLQNNEQGTLELPGVTLSPIVGEGSIAKFDLTLNASENEQGLLLDWEYNTDLFEDKTIERMAGHFDVLLASLLREPETPVLAAQLLTAPQIEQQLMHSNDTKTDFVHPLCIAEVFEAQAIANAQAIAVVFAGQQTSYGELNRRANQLAHYLVDNKGVKPDTMVGICVERSLEMVIGLLAILKAGGAYVPLDANYPKARLDFMRADANLTTVIQDIDEALWSHCSTDNIATQQLGLNASHLAYVIYTSGSTGQPKGVMVEQRNVVSLVVNSDFVTLNAQSVLLQNAPVTFDAATFEIWGALLNGAKLVIQGEPLLDPNSLGQFIKHHQITTAWMTSGLFDLFAAVYEQPLPALENLLVGGDVVNQHSVDRMRSVNSQLNLINGYGPTENTTFSTSYLIPAKVKEGGIAIGKPLANRTAYVLDGHLSVVPVGVTGELYVGGAGVARGYLNQPQLSKALFIDDPFEEGARLYKTGDLVRRRDDGHLVFVARVDHQVKVRGFRIELGEIEQQLAATDLVNDAVVVAKQSSTGDKYLVAYVTCSHHQDNLSSQLHYALCQDLPDYMIPSSFVVMDSLPLTNNGKVDRKALPDPDLSLLQNEYVEPTTATEIILSQMWQQMLDLEQVGITDNFFDLGGHSLLAMKLLSAMESKFAVVFNIKVMFELKDLKNLAAHIDVITPAVSESECDEDREVFEL
jgi:amino acid adenylation domain-containing protein